MSQKSNQPFSRRTALKAATATSALTLLPVKTPASEENSFKTFLPQEKKLDPKLVELLYQRGNPTRWKGAQAKFIGMPIGGLCCGQLYLGGDGKLWHWDICGTPTGWNMDGITSGKHYANPLAQHAPFEYAVEIEVGDKTWNLDFTGFPDATFENRYPMGVVQYENANCPVVVELKAWSPFIPLNTADSSLPIVILDYSVSSKTGTKVEGEIRLKIENPIGKYTKRVSEISRSAFRSRLNDTAVITFESHVLPRPLAAGGPDFILSDFESDSYKNWKVEGTAFGTGPMKVSELPVRYREANPVGKAFVNSHQSRNGEESVEADQHTGKLTSPEFTIRGAYINFLIGGGNHPGKTCLNLIIDGKVVRTATGRNTIQLRKDSFDVKEFAGKTAQLEIVDSETGGWGHITVDQIVMSANPDTDELPIAEAGDFGSFSIAAFSAQSSADPNGGIESGVVTCKFNTRSKTASKARFAIAWYFPNLGVPTGDFLGIRDVRSLKRNYANRFKSASGVIAYFQKQQRKLESDTFSWIQCWYESSLPNYFLERAIIPIDCLQTATANWFDNGRFYAWEGVYCCAGTCQHVWNYAQAAARLFPELEMSVRSKVDFGLSWQPDGTIWYRGEFGQHLAHDGQAGTIIRTFREHSNSPDSSFLKVNWPKIKKSVERLIADDPNKDGVWEGEQYNTLDASWYGKISWLSSLYIGALRAGEAMANEMGDATFANELRRIIESGAQLIVKETFNGEYFAMVRDPGHPRAPGHGPGCHIDQVFGDSFLHMVGLPPNLPRSEVKSGLKSIWKYNYTADAGGYMTAMQSVIKGGRWYAMPGEPGLLMTTFPKGGARESKGEGNPDWMVGYFNECMNGFEYQAAAHMIAEGMVTEGLMIVHALHTRYSNGTRNPYNEIECSDHYSRSMASYGAFLTACGFAYHGPKGEITFDPKIPGSSFKAAFTAAEGWGTFSQNKSESGHTARLHLAYGKLSLNQITLPQAQKMKLKSVLIGSKKIKATCHAGVVHFDAICKLNTASDLVLEFEA